MQDVLNAVLLLAVLSASAVTIHAFASSLLSGVFSSPETQFHISSPLRIEKTFYKDLNTCFALRNPNDEPVDVNSVSVYINGHPYTPSSDSNTIPPEGVATVCVPYVPYIPSGNEEVQVSAGGTSSSSSVPPEEAPETIELYCSSCSDCTSKLQTALSLAQDYSRPGIVYLTQDISSSSTCIFLSDIDFNDLVTFDGQGHVITGSGFGASILLNRVSGLIVRNTTLTNFYYGILLWFSPNNTFSNITTNNNIEYGIYLDSSSTISLLDSNSYACGNLTDIYFPYSSDSELNCIDCGNGYYFHYDTVHGSGLNCDCSAPCP